MKATLDPLSAIIATAVQNAVRDEFQKRLPVFLAELASSREARTDTRTANPKSLSLLSIKEVAALINVSKPTLWRMIRRGGFVKSIQVSPGRVGFRPEEVREWLRSR